MPIAFDYAARSHVGMVRGNNQDSAYAGPHLLAMADGMGGHAGGDVASSIVIGALVDLDDDALSSADAGPALLRRIREANAEISERIEEDPRLDGMGTTLIAILRTRDKLVLAHIGDSRAFLVRGGEVTQITKDHSFVQSLVDEGRISVDEASTHPQRSLVTRVLTGRAEDEPDLVVRRAVAGDRYLVASDGLTDFVAADTVREVLCRDEPPAAVADQLVDLALRAGAPDNVTVVVGDVVDIARTKPPSTVPQIVGSAALRSKGPSTKPIPVTPAEKAAALRAETSGSTDDEEPDDLELAEEGRRSKGVRRLRAIAVAVVVIVVLAGGGYAGYRWTQTQFYVGDYQGNVTVFRGVDASIGPIDLSTPVTISDVKVSDLPDFYSSRIRDGVDRPDEASAAALVGQLRLEAMACVVSRLTGKECEPTGSTDVTPGPSPSTTPSTPPSPTTSPSTTKGRSA
ncbi:PP2C-family Ser/Thr phosphatase [Nostocoides japonicum T1-X7]|uniref:PP2C-family Ser/Thr phosphatase n=1 Tax=Nostocoides japonicum T1-X7 TaxID=1194083 RepID=A0A077M647_9MICO|nr:protein phosphatase 2C domain-containing protein [Tetrasphaera japonica]CCH80522.1 PP2C-family Ser/Thr phosphatase [Tetrasphaera japonica T1-X7]